MKFVETSARANVAHARCDAQQTAWAPTGELPCKWITRFTWMLHLVPQINVNEAFLTIATDVVDRLLDSPDVSSGVRLNAKTCSPRPSWS